MYSEATTAPDDILLFESGEWAFWGDLNAFEAAECESRDYTIVRFESAQWQELVRKETPSPYLPNKIGAIPCEKLPKTL